MAVLKNLWQVVVATGRPAFALMLLLQFAHVHLAQAAFDDMGRGARSTGMADVFVGVADDVNALYYNPAGLAQIRDAYITTEYGQLLGGTDDDSSLGTSYLGYAYPFKEGRKGTMAFGFHNFKAANLFNERTLSLSYGWKLKVEPFGWRGTWLAGASVKQLHREFKPDRFTENALNDAGLTTGQADPLFADNGLTKDTYALDLGGLYRFGQGNRWSTGLAVINLNRPDVSLGNDGDHAPLITKFGVSYRPDWGVISIETRRARRLASKTDNEFGLGAERRFQITDTRAVTVRSGYAEGSREFKAFTAGASYLFGRAEIDYAFNFPIGNLSDLGGSHRLGFSFRIGVPSGKEKEDERVIVDILSSFTHDSSAAHVILSRLSKAERLNDYKRLLLLQTILRQFPIDDEGLKDVRKDLSKLLDDFKSQLMGWAELKSTLLMKVNPADRTNAEGILDLFAEGDIKFSLARMGLFTDETRKSDVITGVTVMGLAELAAQSYRAKDIDSTIDWVKQILDILPKDDPINKAYRQLLLERTRLLEKAKPKALTPLPVQAETIEIPEAPAVLTAPKPEPVPVEELPAETKTSEFEKLVERYGMALGQYFQKKALGASLVERQHMLRQLKQEFGGKGLELTIVHNEVSALMEEIRAKRKTLKTPVKKQRKFQPKTIRKPAPRAMSPELKKAWDFYTRATARGLSDHEKLELLESILFRFGEEGAKEINQELEKIKRRLNK